MRVRFWGTRGSIAKPGPTTVRYGGNTSCVEVRTDDGGVIVIDCGTGAHGLGQALQQEFPQGHSGALLISHTHWDHIQGIPFFAPLFDARNSWRIYGPRGSQASLRDVLSGQMEYSYFPVSLESFNAKITYHEVMEGEFRIGGARIIARYLNHPAITIGYRVEADGASFVYASDHEPHDRHAAAGDSNAYWGEDSRHLDFIRDADLVVHDAQYTAAEYPAKVGWGHSTIEYVVDAAVRGGVKHVVLYHHDPLRTDDAVDRLLDVARARAAAAPGLTVSGAREGDVLTLIPARDGAAAAESQRSALEAPRILGDAVVIFCAVQPRDRQALTEAAQAEDVVCVSGGPKEALREAQRRRDQNVVIVMGDAGIDPLAECRTMRRAGLAAPVIVVADQPRAESEEAGVSDWLLRPFSTQYARTRMKAWFLRAACRWRNAPLPRNEATRLRTLRALGLLDTPAEERFDRHTRIAAAALGAPMAALTLVDEERQWFKSRIGIDTHETHRDRAICAHVVQEETTLVVPDTLEDERFADNPLVSEEQRVRFYAGVPIAAPDGTLVGTLCVMDHRPRELNAAQVSLLEDIAALIEREFEADPD